MKKSWEEGISVIIPTFNRVQYLYATLICLCNQKVVENVNYEIIVVDSGDDETESMVASLQKMNKVSIKYKKIKKCKNRSLLRNIGEKLSKYSLLCFLDNDMLVPPDFIEIHFYIHFKNPHTIVMGARRFLTEFDVFEFGEEKLATNFESLEKLAWYTDERINEDMSAQLWRFVYSHTLSLERDDFLLAGKFNNAFGDSWGFEDIELGIRLQKINCNFYYMKNYFAYHQPHFNQSQIDQKQSVNNGSLFMKIHNYYEVELFNCFKTNFHDYYYSLKKIEEEKIYPNEKMLKEFDVIFGTLMSIDDTKIKNKLSKKTHLGIYSIEDNDSKKKIFILNQFFKFPELIKISILFEAFRISSRVYFENISLEQENEIMDLTLASGIVVKSMKKSKYTIFLRDWNQDSKLFLILLPDILQPEKRYVYLWLANKLLSTKHYVKIRDMKNSCRLDMEDFSLKETERRSIEKNIDRFFGKNRLQFITSSALLMSDFEIDFPRTKSSYVFFDDDYQLMYDSIKQRHIGMCTCFDETVYSYITALSVHDLVNDIKDKNTKVNHNSYCCFMENGFFEDGIDFIINVFRKNKDDFKLTIKIPDYEKIKEEIFPLHNKTSKNAKTFSSSQKFENDYRMLKQAIIDYGLSGKVRIIKQNLSMTEIVNLIAENETLLCASRTICGFPEAYIAIFLRKKIIIPEHLRIVKELKKICILVKSSPVFFADELKLPISCINSNYYAYRVDEEDLFCSLQKSPLLLSEQDERKIINDGNKFFDEVFG